MHCSIISSFMTLFMLLLPTQSIHFYLETGLSKCFFEDLPKDTLVVGKFDAYEWSKTKNDYIRNQNLAVELTVEETFDNDHKVVQQSGPSEGEFTFTSLDSGEHKFCLTPRHKGSFWTGSKLRTRIFLDMAIGDATEFIDSNKKDTINHLQEQIEHLNSMLKEIQRHQSTIKDKESEFRSNSELVNSNVVKWTIIQILVLILVGYAQTRYLRTFFKKEKMI